MRQQREGVEAFYASNLFSSCTIAVSMVVVPKGARKAEDGMGTTLLFREE